MVEKKCSLLPKADDCMEEDDCAQKTRPISGWKALSSAAAGVQHAPCNQTLRAQALIQELQLKHHAQDFQNPNLPAVNFGQN